MCGLVYTLIGVVVQLWVRAGLSASCPRFVTGAVVAVIGLNLAAIAVDLAANN